ncbi:MAG: hypothetical protein WDO73_36050 [Ignavibacteriota bacterium]
MTINPNAKILRLQAAVLLESLPDLCRKENRSAEAALRVASHLVYDEDVLQKPPQQCRPSIEQAKKYHRLLRKAADAEYPESDRRFHLDNEAKGRKLFPFLYERAGTEPGDEISEGPLDSDGDIGVDG